MAIETLPPLLQATVIVIASAGFLWAIAWSIPSLFVRFGLTTVRNRAPILQALIIVGGVTLLGRFAGEEAATNVAVIIAVVWCGTVLRETYLRATYHMPVAPGAGESTQPANNEVAVSPGKPSGMETADLLSTVSMLFAMQIATLEPFTKRTGAEPAAWRSPADRPPARASAVEETIEPPQIPYQQLSQRPPLGKRTIEAFQKNQSTLHK